jgi:hypothetical protein
MRDTARKKREIMYQAVLHSRSRTKRKYKSTKGRSAAVISERPRRLLLHQPFAFSCTRPPAATRPVVRPRRAWGTAVHTRASTAVHGLFLSLFFDLCIKKKEEKKCMLGWYRLNSC